MQYRPVLPEHNDNVSHSEPLKEFAEIALSLAIAGLLIFWAIGFFVDQIVDGMSAETEAAISKRMPSSSNAVPPALLARQKQVQALVDGLRTCTTVRRPTPMSLTEAAALNAAVSPGGNMTVFTGLLSSKLSENGLSFVLAHELAHIEHRDHLRGMGRGIATAVVMATVTGGSGDIEVLTAPAMKLGMSKYSRTREAAADLRALDILHCRYGHVGGATELFEKLKADESSWSLSHYVASHPGLGDRIAALGAHAQARRYKHSATTAFRPAPNTP